MQRMISGVKPTGKITLGNYLGALKQFVKYQDEYEMYIFVANLHCLTVDNDPKVLKKNLRDLVLLYLACGIDPKKTTLFLQSDVLPQAQLGFIMCCHTYMGELNRMTQFKDMMVKHQTNINGGLFTYPTLMAADILAYQADYVPVGDDQKQHIELTRNLAERFNNKYGETFKVPQPLIPKIGSRIMSLSNPTKKMSKSEDSDKGCIYLLDDLSSVRKKIMSAVTDSENLIKYDPINKPGVSNLLQILSSVTDQDIDSLVQKYQHLNYGEFKKIVADACVDLIGSIQARYQALDNQETIEQILKEGALKANQEAYKTLRKAERKLGINIYKR